jgi:hypothetical protein
MVNGKEYLHLARRPPLASRVGHPGHALDFVFPAAGSSNVLVMIEQRFTERRAQPVVLEFHSGANAEIGARIVATNPLLLRPRPSMHLLAEPDPPAFS